MELGKADAGWAAGVSETPTDLESTDSDDGWLGIDDGGLTWRARTTHLLIHLYILTCIYKRKI